jgi:MFS family permease
MINQIATANPGSADFTRGRWRALAVIALAQVGAMSTWFSAAAVAPSLAREWHLGPSQLALLTVAVQLGFVTGGLAVAVSGLADLVSPRWVFAIAALLAAVANAALVFVTGNLALAVMLRFVLGAALAGVYPIGMKMMTEWFRENRGLAIGTVVAALTLGAAVPHALVRLGVSGTITWQPVILTTSGCAVAGAVLIAALVRPGPFAVRADRLDLAWAVRSMRAPAFRLANFGYFGHMWELYAMWTWLPAFLLASARVFWGTLPDPAALRWASGVAAVAIGAGAVGCVAGGVIADRWGRTTLASLAMVISGTSAVLAALLFGRAPLAVAAVVTVWGISVIADSAQFSASISELAERDRVGSALALQTALGFLLTAISIQVLPLIAARVGWPVAITVLAVGPALGTVAMLRLRRRPEAVRLAGGRR